MSFITVGKRGGKAGLWMPELFKFSGALYYFSAITGKGLSDSLYFGVAGHSRCRIQTGDTVNNYALVVDYRSQHGRDAGEYGTKFDITKRSSFNDSYRGGVYSDSAAQPLPADCDSLAVLNASTGIITVETIENNYLRLLGAQYAINTASGASPCPGGVASLSGYVVMLNKTDASITLDLTEDSDYDFEIRFIENLNM